MYSQSKEPALELDLKKAEAFFHALCRAGYHENRLSLSRRDEFASFKKVYKSSSDGLRQNHLQLVIHRGEPNKICVYAHTEPDNSRTIMHTICAVLDGMNFSGGKRMLLSDLKRVGWK